MTTEETKNPVGRPASYDSDVLDKALNYLKNYNTEHGHAIPSVVGLCRILNRGRSTVYDWINKEHDSYHEEFSDIVDSINEYQHFDLMDGGLTNKFNSNITKLLLHKHGHSDKQETEISGDLSITKIQREIVDPKDPNS